MKLSIIIPSYNTEKLLEDCVCSIIAQTAGNAFEIIIVDNHSDYDVKKQIAGFNLKFPKNIIKLIANDTNLGFAKACNQGIKISSGENILFLNSDIVILENSVDKALAVLAENNEVDILGCKLLNPDHSIQASAGYFPKLRQIFFLMFFIDDLPLVRKMIKPFHQNDIWFYEQPQEVDWVTGAFLLARKRVIREIGGFSEDFFMYAEEVDFCFRAKKKNFKVFYDNRPEVIHIKEVSPRNIDNSAILAEYKGLKLFFRKHKPVWEMPFLRIFLWLGALVRIFVFGILLGNELKKEIYIRALTVA